MARQNSSRHSTTKPKDSQNKPKASKAAYPPILTIREAAAYLRISVWTLYEQTSRSKVPHFRIGTAIRFKLSELEAWASGYRPSQPARTGGSRKR